MRGIAVMFKDLIYIDDNANFIKSGSNKLINFTKRRLFAKQITQLLRFQSCAFNLTRVPELSEYLLRVRGFPNHYEEVFEARGRSCGLVVAVHVNVLLLSCFIAHCSRLLTSFHDLSIDAPSDSVC